MCVCVAALLLLLFLLLEGVIMAIAISIARFPGAVAENLGFVSSFRHSLPATAAAPAPHPGSEPKPCRLFPLLLVSLSSTSSSSSRGVVIEKTSSSRQERIQTPSTLSPAQRAVHGKKSPSPSPSSPAPRFSKAARRFYNETFREPQRLSKVLAAAGVASRRTCEDIIFDARVTVNGDVCKIPQTLVDPLKDSIYIDGKSLPKKMSAKLYFVLNKPKGYICSSSEDDEKSVIKLFDDYMKIWVQRNPGMLKPRLFTVGRLDVATTGLLFVTNDGDFAQNVSHPSSGLTKEYIATVGNKVTKRQVQAILDGTEVQGVHCVPESVEVVAAAEQGDSRIKLRIVVSEGRNHEVRHLVENAGLEVHALKRVRIGGYRLPRTLGLGKYLLLTEANVRNANLISQGKKKEKD